MFSQRDLVMACHIRNYSTSHVCACAALASFPGRVGGEKTAWYPLLAHARAFPEKPGNLLNGQ